MLLNFHGWFKNGSDHLMWRYRTWLIIGEILFSYMLDIYINSFIINVSSRQCDDKWQPVTRLSMFQCSHHMPPQASTPCMHHYKPNLLTSKPVHFMGSFKVNNLKYHPRIFTLYAIQLKNGIKNMYFEFPHSAFARGPRSPVLEEGMRAAMGATRECCAGPYA